MKHRKMFFLVSGCLGLAALVATADNQVEWGTTSLYTIYDHTTTNPLSATPFGDGQSYLVQLIWDAAADGPDPVNVSTNTGTSGDDVMVAWSWIGRSYPPAQRPGHFLMSGTNSYMNTQPNGAQYFIRAWEGPSQAAGTGYIPASPLYYGNSTNFVIAGNGSPPATDYFYLNNDFSTTLMVPEPTVASLLAFGCVTLFVGTRTLRRKNGKG